jgi:hypothetical protein
LPIAEQRLTSVDGVPYAWDANGNLLSDGVYTYTFNHANQLVGVSGAGTTVSYSYRCNGLSSDAWGIIGCESDRVSQTVNGVTTHYVLDQAAGLTQVLSDGTNTYLYGVGRIAQYSETGPEYFLNDALGSMRQLVDANGSVTLAKDYEPYGEALTSAGSGATSYGYSGEMTDATGLIYLRARYLDLNRAVMTHPKPKPRQARRWVMSRLTGQVHERSRDRVFSLYGKRSRPVNCICGAIFLPGGEKLGLYLVKLARQPPVSPPTGRIPGRSAGRCRGGCWRR